LPGEVAEWLKALAC